jgi:hypothetical protein
MNFPATDTFELGKLLLCCFDRPFSTGSRSDHDRALAAPKKSLVSRYFIDKANAVARHSCPHRLDRMIIAPWAFGPNDLNQLRRARVVDREIELMASSDQLFGSGGSRGANELKSTGNKRLCSIAAPLPCR